MAENIETRISSEQAKEAIYKINKLSESGMTPIQIADAIKKSHDFTSKEHLYTKTEVDSLISGLVVGLDWKESVNNFEDLATAYPNAQEGWTVSVNNEDVIYRFDGETWIKINNAVVPMASAVADGKMSKEDFIKLSTLEPKSQVVKDLESSELTPLEIKLAVEKANDIDNADIRAISELKNTELTPEMIANAVLTANNVKVFTGSTETEAGILGYVPTPKIGDQTKYLKGDGTWATVEAAGGSGTTMIGQWINVNFPLIKQETGTTDKTTLDNYMKNMSFYPPATTFNNAEFPKAKVAWSTTDWYYTPTTKIETASQVYYASICSDSNGNIYGIDRSNMRIMRSIDGGKTFQVFRSKPTTTPVEILTLMGLTVSTIDSTGNEYLILWCSQNSSNSAYLCHTKVSVTTTTDWTNFAGMGSAIIVSNYGYMDTSIYGSNGSAIVSASYSYYGIAEILGYNGSTWSRKYCYPVSSTDTAFIPTSSSVGRVADDQFYTVLFINTAGTIRYLTNVHSGMSVGATGTELSQSIVTATNKIVFNKYDRKFYICDHTTGKLAQILMNASGVPQAPVDKGYVGGASQAGWNILAIDHLGNIIFGQNGTTNMKILVKDATSFSSMASVTASLALPVAGSVVKGARNVLGCNVATSASAKPSFYFHNFSTNDSASTAYTMTDVYFDSDYPLTATTPASPATETADTKYYIKMG